MYYDYGFRAKYTLETQQAIVRNFAIYCVFILYFNNGLKTQLSTQLRNIHCGA